MNLSDEKYSLIIRVVGIILLAIISITSIGAFVFCIKEDLLTGDGRGFFFAVASIVSIVFIGALTDK